jgi:hypothetical protein
VGKTVYSRSGKNLPIGGPKRIFNRERVIELRRKGASIRQIVRQLGVGVAAGRADFTAACRNVVTKSLEQGAPLDRRLLTHPNDMQTARMQSCITMHKRVAATHSLPITYSLLTELACTTHAQRRPELHPLTAAPPRRFPIGPKTQSYHLQLFSESGTV